MALTDYISPDTLREEGYIYKGDIDEMIACIGADALKARGLVNISQLSKVRLSTHKAAEVIGIHQATLSTYISAGLVKTDKDGRVLLLDALTFDYANAKQLLLKQKTRIKNK